MMKTEFLIRKDLILALWVANHFMYIDVSYLFCPSEWCSVSNTFAVLSCGLTIRYMWDSYGSGSFTKFAKLGINMSGHLLLSLSHMLSPSSIMWLWDSPIRASRHYGTWWWSPPATTVTYRLGCSAAPTQQAPTGWIAFTLIDGQLEAERLFKQQQKVLADCKTNK